MNKSSIKIILTGDLAPLNSAETKEKNNYSLKIESKLTELFKSSDLAITNLEAPLTLSHNKIKKTGPHLKAHPESIKLLKDLNIGVTCLSNNHIRDYGTQGVLDTIKTCNKNGIATVGAGKDLKDASKSLIKTIKCKKIAIFNFSETEYNVATEERAGSNPDDEIHIWESLKNAKQEYDFIIVVMHSGKEMYPYPTPEQMKLFRFIVDIGADAVIGHHSHVIGGYEIYKNKPIVYSLGNFIFDEEGNDDPWYEGALAKLTINNNNIDLKFYKTKLENNKISITDIDSVSYVNEEIINSEWQKLIKKNSNQIIKNLIKPNIFQRLLFKIGIKKITNKQKKKLIVLGNRFLNRTHKEITTEIINRIYDD